MGNIKDTQYFQAVQDKKIEVSDVLEQVYIALTEKGYNPVNQIVGYIMSGDPTYITSHKGARSLIMKVERDEILAPLWLCILMPVCGRACLKFQTRGMKMLS